jgi:hypothetical protein
MRLRFLAASSVFTGRLVGLSDGEIRARARRTFLRVLPAEIHAPWDQEILWDKFAIALEDALSRGDDDG